MAYTAEDRAQSSVTEPQRLPLTILQVLPGLVSGGAERGAVDVAAAVVRAGGRAIIVSTGDDTRGGGALMRELRRAGGEHVRMDVASKNPLTIRANGRRLARLIRDSHVDVIHARSRAPAWSSKRAAELTGIPFVTTFHAAYKFKSEAKRRYNSIMARGDKVIAISDFIAGHIRQVYGTDAARIVTIARGVDVDRFNRSTVSEERMIRLLSAWRVPDHLPVLLMPSRLSRIKGHSVLVEAMALRRQVPDVQDVYCVMVGATESSLKYRRELESLISERGLEGLVRLVDHCNDMPAAYELAHLVVAPSIVEEGFGRVPVEALAMGKPVIASALGGFLETIEPGRTGLLVPPGNAEALATAIEEVMGLDTTQRQELAEYAESHVRERFTRQAMCDATLQVYREIIAAKAREGSRVSG